MISEPKALRIYKTEDYKLVTLLDSSTQRICSLAVRNSSALASSISHQVYVQREYMVLAAVVTRGQPLTVFLPSYYAAWEIRSGESVGRLWSDMRERMHGKFLWAWPTRILLRQRERVVFSQSKKIQKSNDPTRGAPLCRSRDPILPFRSVSSLWYVSATRPITNHIGWNFHLIVVETKLQKICFNVAMDMHNLARDINDGWRISTF